MLKIHPIAEVFPMLDEDAFQQLCSDIAEHGLQRQIVTWRGELIDGRNRMRALIALGLDPGEYCRALADDADPVSYALSANLHRRHLTESQRAMIGQRVKELCSKDASARMVAGKAVDDPSAHLRQGLKSEDPSAHVRQGKSASFAAEAVSVSPRLIENAERVVSNGVPELGAAVIGGTVSLGAAVEISKLEPEEQAEVLAEGPEFVKEVAAEKRKERRKDRTEAKAEVQAARVPGVEPDRSDLFEAYMDPNDILGYLRKLMPRIPDKTILAEMLFAISDEYERYRIPELWEEWNRKRVRA
jgi:hypothetical protein